MKKLLYLAYLFWTCSVTCAQNANDIKDAASSEFGVALLCFIGVVLVIVIGTWICFCVCMCEINRDAREQERIEESRERIEQRARENMELMIRREVLRRGEIRQQNRLINQQHVLERQIQNENKQKVKVMPSRSSVIQRVQLHQSQEEGNEDRDYVVETPFYSGPPHEQQYHTSRNVPHNTSALNPQLQFIEESSDEETDTDSDNSSITPDDIVDILGHHIRPMPLIRGTTNPPSNLPISEDPPSYAQLSTHSQPINTKRQCYQDKRKPLSSKALQQLHSWPEFV